MKIEDFSWKRIGVNTKRYSRLWLKSTGCLLLMLFIVIGLCIVVAGKWCWKWIQFGWNKLVEFIDKNPRVSVATVFVTLLLVILAMFVQGRIDQEKAIMKIDSLMINNDNLKTSSMYDIGYSVGYKDGNTDTMKAIGK